MRKEKLHSPWLRETAGIVPRALTAAHARLERPPFGRTALKVIILLASAVAVVAVLLAPRGAHASATIIVNTGNESNAGDGFCSLREAINNANNPGTDYSGGDCNVGTGSDTIAVFVLNGKISISSSLPAIYNTLTIVGPGQTVPIVPEGYSRIFVIKPSAKVLLNDLALASASVGTTTVGGAIYNSGTLTVSNCTFTTNGSGSSGGAIANEVGSLYISNSTFNGNKAYTGGGAIVNDSGVVSISNSTFASNSSNGSGGAIFNGPNQLLVISNSTFSGNTAALGRRGQPLQFQRRRGEC